MPSAVRAASPSRAAPRSGTDRSAAVGAAAWVAVVVVGLVAGARLGVERRDVMALRAAPLAGDWDLAADWRFLPAAAFGVAAVVVAPVAVATASWRRLLAVAGAATVAWSTLLAAGRGWREVAAPLTTRWEYLAVVDRIGDPHTFLRTYTERLGGYPTHVKGHPPGIPLVLWTVDRLHLAGGGWAAALVLAGGGLATVAALVVVRSVAGEAAARRAAPFVALAPTALWLGTSADALVTGVAAAGIAMVVAARRPVGHVAGGVVLSAAAFLSYGVAPLLAVPVAVAAVRRDVRPLVPAAAGAASVGLAFAVAGFWWFDGLGATRGFYAAGVAPDRPYALFVLVFNPAALFLAVGPAAVAGLVVTARSVVGRPVGASPGRRWVLPLAAFAAVVAADLSGLSKGEVERIWLPFTPWLLTATAAAPSTHGPTRVWLAGQVAVALVLAVALRSPW